MENVTRLAEASRRRLQIQLDGFGRASIRACAARLDLTVDEFLARAAMHYVAGRDSGRLAWRVPDFRREQAAQSNGGGFDSPLQVTVRLGDDAWQALEDECERQSVLLEELIRHAALTLLADLDRPFLSPSG